jgi:hypothetical protein
MKLCISSAIVLAAFLGGAPALVSQQPPAGSPPQSPPAASPPDSQRPAQNPPQSTGNPFPGDTNNVPVLPNSSTSPTPESAPDDSLGRVSLPALDSDPARSPDERDSGASMPPATESSSSLPDSDRFHPADDEDTKRKGKDAPEFKETAANDIDVGNYELQRKNWKAALSRFQSAMVLNPEDPEAFWGMAEAARHLGDFSSAKSYYLKVVDYDPDSRHGKEARRALKDPEIANAQSTARTPPAQPQK